MPEYAAIGEFGWLSGRRMLQSVLPASVPDPDRALAVIRRLVVEFGLAQWHRYAMAFALMGVAAQIGRAHV